MMAQRSTPDGWGSPADAPANVRVTVVPGPRPHPVRDRSGASRAGVGLPVVVAAIVLVTAAGAIVAIALRGGRPVSAAAVHGTEARTTGDAAAVHGTEARATGDAAAVHGTATSTAGVAGIAAAYRYPLGCLGITLSADRSSMLGRHSPCWRYGVYVTAVLRRVNGVWRLMLEATSTKCPDVTLPDIVRSALVACERGTAP
jgi:hypothetical protein